MSQEYKGVFTQTQCVINEINEYLKNGEKYEDANTPVYTDLFDIAIFLSLYQHKIGQIALKAHRYDLDEVTRANGYRSQIKIYAKMLNEIQMNFGKFKIYSHSYFKDTSQCKLKIKCWKEHLIAYYPIICTVLKLMNNYPDQLIAEKDNEFNKHVLKNYGLFTQTIFYGRLFGFQFNKKFTKIINLLVSSLASYAWGYETSSSKIVQAMVMVSQNGYYMLHPHKRAETLQRVLLAPTIEFCKSFIGLTDDLGLYSISCMIGPHVDINTKVSLKIIDFSVKTLDNSEFNVLKGAQLLKDKIDTVITCRLLSFSLHEGQNQFFQAVVSANAKIKPNSDNLLIYFHGGGFIGLSAKVCDIYLREWASDFQFPIFCIDYTLSPEAIFPYAIHECFYTYCWALAKGQKIGWNGKKVVFFGDSAGGNLVFAVAQMAIKHGIRPPDGLVCAYPSCDTSIGISPSRFLVQIDPFLSSGFLSVVRKSYFGLDKSKPADLIVGSPKIKRHCTITDNIDAEPCDRVGFYRYIGMEDSVLNYYKMNEIDPVGTPIAELPKYALEYLENDPSEDPLASPVLIDSKILRVFPPVRIIISDMDPLLDEGIAMCRKLLANNVNLHLDIISDVPHGFLQFISTSSEVKHASDLILARVRELLYLV